MISLKRKQTGFTIVELLIVIVVIGILAAIVITTFVGVQKRARDAERKSDLQAISSQIEVYFADATQYPTLDELNDLTPSTGFVAKNLKGLKPEALADPSDSSTQALTATVPAVDSATYQYAYVATQDDGTACDNSDGSECTAFTLTANLENDDNANQVITGSNN